MKNRSRILCIGEEWRGSNASGLFYALSRSGCIVNIVNELQYVSVQAITVSTKSLNRLTRSFQVNDFNYYLKLVTKSFKPDLVLVYKGAFIKQESILCWKKAGIPVVNFFPDVSFLAHGKYIPKCIPLYDHIFTTKTFAAKDLQSHFNYSSSKVSFIPHGFDPLVHQKLDSNQSEFMCDASFIGNYSAHKSQFLAYLKREYPQLDLKIWGGTWKHIENALMGSVMGIGIHGDLYVDAINASTINIALLSELVKGASTGDQITSRTFHIPASGGFMLHQRTEELLSYFEEDKEVACFSSKEELVEKIKFYLGNDTVRKKIQENGHNLVVKNHSLDERANRILLMLREKGIIK